MVFRYRTIKKVGIICMTPYWERKRGRGRSEIILILQIMFNWYQLILNFMNRKNLLADFCNNKLLMNFVFRN